MSFYALIRQAEHWPELRRLPDYERVILIHQAVERVRRDPRYWAVALAAVTPGLALVIAAAQFELELDTRWAWFAGAYALLVVFGAGPFARRLLRHALRLELLREDVRPAVCFRCRYDLTGSGTGVCPECGERIGHKSSMLEQSPRAGGRTAPDARAIATADTAGAMTTAVHPAVETILSQDTPDGAAEDAVCEQVEALIPVLGWEPVRQSILNVLASDRSMRDYRAAAAVLWGAVLDGRSLPADRVIALLYHRFDPRGDSEDNLAWSITSKLKGVGYLSDYQPLEDPAVRAELDAIRGG